MINYTELDIPVGKLLVAATTERTNNSYNSGALGSH